jgi:hypothetical protein
MARNLNELIKTLSEPLIYHRLKSLKSRRKQEAAPSLSLDFGLLHSSWTLQLAAAESASGFELQASRGLGIRVVPRATTLSRFLWSRFAKETLLELSGYSLGVLAIILG